jgi:hypothetical protein
MRQTLMNCLGSAPFMPMTPTVANDDALPGGRASRFSTAFVTSCRKQRREDLESGGGDLGDLYRGRTIAASQTKVNDADGESRPVEHLEHGDVRRSFVPSSSSSRWTL